MVHGARIAQLCATAQILNSNLETLRLLPLQPRVLQLQ